MIATAGTVYLAEWIIDDACLVRVLFLHGWYPIVILQSMKVPRKNKFIAWENKDTVAHSTDF